LDAREVLSDALIASVIDLFEDDTVIDTLEDVQVLVQIDVGRPPMSNPEEYLAKYYLGDGYLAAAVD
jgi:hypothetical protein